MKKEKEHWVAGKGWVRVTLADGTERFHENCKRAEITLDGSLFIEDDGGFIWYWPRQIRSMRRCP
jgi:DNA/RNA-binding domain of Phe-tRNA-synthetase-like protein